jgi:hypothetical protein
VFVADPAEAPKDATAFDIRGAELGHIVHEANLDDERYDAPEAPGLDVALRGLSMINADEEILAVTTPLFNGLYEFFRRELLLGHEPGTLVSGGVAVSPASL